MSKITDKHDYEYGFITISNINVRGLPASIKIDGLELTLKHEFHISLISPTIVAALINPRHIGIEEQDIITDFKTYTASYPLHDFVLTKDYRLAIKDELKTVVVMAEVPGLKRFFSHLCTKYDANFPVQPTHMTLYTLKPDGGIGMISLEQLETYSKSIDLPELEHAVIVGR